jgi:hypothetical protein
MTLQKSIRFAVAGASLLYVFQAHAQLSTYSQDDLLLNFRDASTTTDPDVVVDLGNASTFVGDIAGLSGGTAVLDTVTGVTPTSGYTVLFSAGSSGGTGLLGEYSTPASGNAIGFSAAASDQTSKTIWITSEISSPSLTGNTAPVQSSAINQGKTVNDIAGIGAGAVAGTAFSGGTAGSTALVASGGTHSYQTEAEASVALPAVISYQGSQSTGSGAIESSQTGGGDVYEALWEVPLTPGSPVFEGYFTFAPSGEVDYTTVSTVPEPSTYALLAATGLLAWVFRRQVRSLIA